MQNPTYFTISPGQFGEVYATEFSFTSQLPSQFKKIVWEFGDGYRVYDKKTVTHSYQYPGVYKVRLSAWSVNELFVGDYGDVSVDYIYRDRLYFSSLPKEISMAGIPTAEPFELTVISAKINEPIYVNLYSLNSRSLPYEVVAEEKWRSIIPKWRFLDGNTKQLVTSAIQVKVDPIYKNSKVVAVSGKCHFYYLDDSPTVTSYGGCPVFLLASLSTQHFSYPPESLVYPYYSYANNESVRTATAWEVNNSFVTELKVTENFINDIYPVKWSQIPIPVMVTGRFIPQSIPLLANTPGVSATDVLTYPNSNEVGKRNAVVLTLSGTSYISPTSYTVQETPLYFQNKDSSGNNVAGYVFTTITPLVSFDGTVVVAASTVAWNFEQTADTFDIPLGLPLNAAVFVSNPYKSCINKVRVYSSNYLSECELGLYYKKEGFLIEGSVETTKVPKLTTNTTVNYEMSGTSAVYGLAFNPLKNKLYACDADQDTLMYFEQGKTLLSSINLSSIITPHNNTTNAPAYISIDSEENIWVSLYDNHTLLKFDSSLNFLCSAFPNNITIPLSTAVNQDFLISPPVAETDRENNVWACYASPISSMLVKYDYNGNEIYQVSESLISVSSVPVSISIDRHNNPWIACYASGEIININSLSGTLIKKLTGISHPSYTSMSRSNNLWVTHGYNYCSYINTNTHEMSTWRFFSQSLQTSNPVTQFSTGDIQLLSSFDPTPSIEDLTENEIWSGLGTDVFDRVWLINGTHNVVVLFNPYSPKDSQIINIQPRLDTNYVLLCSNETITTEVDSENPTSAQAAGDFNGNKWYQKYATGYGSLSVYGKSTPFSVYDINNAYNVVKNNEEFDMPKHLKSLALPEVFSRHTELFDSFLKGILGDSNPLKENIGRVFYEKIANFTDVHGDVDTAGIRQLNAYARETSTSFNSFGGEFPAEINRLLDLFSVPKYFLRGNILYDPDIENNIGPVITYTSLVTANQKMFIRDKRYSNSYNFVIIPPFGETMVYPISVLDIPGLRFPLFENYYFFEYKELPMGYVNNIINWNSDYTTVSYNLSTNEEWYGENGLVETMFNHLLTKRLFLNEE